MANTVLQNLQAAKVLYSQLLVLVGTVITNPTQANIDAAITAINNGTWSGVLTPKIDYTLDGEGYQWGAWQQHIMEQLEKLNALIQAESMPFCVVSRARA
ncbi:MAG TPA: hypothetical protein VKE94_14705 [Gemmataceae bacterium]|nr:hypothetical protein [Gemmataceae bacterium]